MSKSTRASLLQRHGASEFAYGWKQERAVIQFKMRQRYVRFVLPLPVLGDFTTTATGKARRAGTGAATNAWQQACRQRWRVGSLRTLQWQLKDLMLEIWSVPQSHRIKRNEKSVRGYEDVRLVNF